MSKLNVVISHNLTQEEATRRIKKLLSEVRQEFADKISDPRERWSGSKGMFSFSVMGFAVSGTLRVEPSQVNLSGEIPWTIMFLRGKIESTIRGKAVDLLS